MNSSTTCFSPRVVHALILCLSLFAVTGCDRSEAEAGDAKGSRAAPRAMPVSVRAVEPANIPIQVQVVGQAEGSKSVEVRPRVNGIIEQITFQDGEKILAGAPMYKIERAPFEIALDQAKASLAQERARVVQARQQRNRLKQLRAKNIVSRSDYDAAVASLRTNQAAYRVAEAKVAEAELNLSYTTISAPITGVAGKSLYSQGSLVSATSTQALATIVATDPIWVGFGLNDQQLRLIGEPGAARVSLIDPTGKELLGSGRMNFAGTTVDSRLATIAMRATFANPSRTILPGQFVQVRVRAADRTAYLVPQSAVSQTAKGASVWVVGEGDKAQPRPVKTAEWQGSNWVIEHGLNPGDQVITNNLMKLRPGAPVKPNSVNPAKPSAG